MIKSLHISNYALLKEVNINFKDGFTVVSGETGAGKSIMLDALSLLIGKRVERFSSDKKNAAKSIIEGVFEMSDYHHQFFIDNDLDYELNTVVRREINQNGKSRAFINDTPVLLSTLTAFGKQIIEIHAQHQSIVLKDEMAQFSLIDQLAKSEKELKNYLIEFAAYNQLKKELSNIKSKGSLSLAELEFLQFQFDELYAANIVEGEKETLEQEIVLLENVDGIASAIGESEHFLNNEQGVLSSLSAIKRRLLEFDTFSELSDRVESVLIELNDINANLSDINNRLEADPEQLLKLNTRLDLINNLLQKHRKSFIEELIDLRDEMEQKINLSASFDAVLTTKAKELEAQMLKLEQAANLLTVKRSKIVKKVKSDIEGLLKKLGMPYAQFDVLMEQIDTYHSYGNTSISFQFSGNKGSAIQEISKVASGGELSRLMLAIKYITAQLSKVNILVFDEIDTGVSGEIAALMGDMMKKISVSNQLIAISHLPQIASNANTHLKVVKSVVKDETVSAVLELNKEQRVEEIAKLLSGKKITKAAIDNALELLNQ